MNANLEPQRYAAIAPQREPHPKEATTRRQSPILEALSGIIVLAVLTAFSSAFFMGNNFHWAWAPDLVGMKSPDGAILGVATGTALEWTRRQAPHRAVRRCMLWGGFVALFWFVLVVSLFRNNVPDPRHYQRSLGLAWSVPAMLWGAALVLWGAFNRVNLEGHTLNKRF